MPKVFYEIGTWKLAFKHRRLEFMKLTPGWKILEIEQQKLCGKIQAASNMP